MSYFIYYLYYIVIPTDQYEMVIADSYGNRVIPFRHLCLAMKLQEGRYLDRWVGTMRQKYASKTGVLISSVSGKNI